MEQKIRSDEDFEELYIEFRRFSVRVAFKIVKDRAIAEDISQETFCKLYKKKDEIEFANREKVKALIFYATSNMAKDYLKKAYVKKEINFEDGAEGRIRDGLQSTEDAILCIEKKEYLIAVLKKLKKKNPDNYDIYVKVKLKDIPSAVVAEEYGMSMAGISNRLLRTKIWIRKEIDKLYHE